MYHSKKIGVFISHIFGNYQHLVCQGIIHTAFEYGYTTEIFTSLDGENLGHYAVGEKSILQIPNYDSFDGIIFASDTYISEELRERIRAKLETLSCPIVEVSEFTRLFPSVSMDNNSTAGELTEHMIMIHNASRICYLGCEEESYYSNLRQYAYCEAMKRHNRSIGKHDIYSGYYTMDSVKDALSFFCQDGTPDAVICYNDHLALLFMDAVLSGGFRIPEDMAITGCDNLPEGQNIAPMLTTVSFPVNELGTTAVKNLIAQIQGRELPSTTRLTAEPLYHQSCGCNLGLQSNPFFFIEEQTSRIDTLKGSIIGSMNMSAALQHITDLDEGINLLEKYICEVEHCTEFYVCLYTGWDSASSHILELTDQQDNLFDNNIVQLKLAIKNGKRLTECSYQKKYILPQYLYKASDSSYICIPLFFEEREFGYIVLAYEEKPTDYYFRLGQWQMIISQMLQSICDAKHTGLMVTHLEQIYMTDVLTGFYNKNGFFRHQEQFLDRAIEENLWLTAFVIDIDGLKAINEAYGHEEGDFALQVLGRALNSVTGENDLCSRFSNDEFFVLSLGKEKKEAEALIEQMKSYLMNYNRLSNKKYHSSCCCGFACAPPDSGFTRDGILSLFSEAERMMYSEKAQQHNLR